MNLLKRIGYMILCASVLLSCTAAVSAESAKNTVLNAGELKLLTALEIVDDDIKERIDEPINRGTAVEYVINMLNLKATAAGYNEKSPFFDVTSDEEWFGAVSLAARMGICSGYENGLFGPYDALDFEGASKFLICAMGFSYTMSDGASFPDTYLKMARSAHLLDGIQTGGAFTNGDMLKMIYNALHAETFIQKFEASTGKLTSGQTLLYSVYKILYDDGIVTADSENSYNGVLADDDEVQINGEIFKTNEIITRFVGKSVRYYFKDKSSAADKVIVCICENESDNNEYVYSSENIEKYDETSRTFVCREEDKDKSVNRRISSRATVLINGVPSSSLDSSELIPKDGTVTLIDNDNDKTADYVLIESLETYVVSNLDADRTYVSDSNSGKTLRLDEYEDKNIIVYDKYGSKSNLSGISAGCVLLAAKSRARIIIYVCDDTVSSSINMLFEDNGVKKCKIDNNEYTISPYMDMYSPQRAEVGKDYIFHFDYKGRIAFADIDAAKLNNIAFIIGGKFDESGFEENIILKLINSDGKLIQINLDDNVTIDDVKYKDSNAAWNALKINKYDASGNIVYSGVRNTIVSYIEKDGKIKKLTTAYEMTEDGTIKRPYENRVGSIGYGDMREDGMYMSYRENAVHQYIGLRTFSGYGILNQNVKVFRVPLNSNGTVDSAAADKDYAALGLSYFTNYSKYNMEQFKYSKNSAGADVVVIYYDRTSVKEKPDNKLVPVADIAEGLNADGETVKQLIGIVEGKEVVYTAESDEVLAKVEKGDCVRCYFGTGGELSYAEIIYDQSANKTYSTDASYESAYRIVSKPVYEVKNNSISLADSETSITDVKNGGEILEKYFVESKSLYIYRFDSEKMKFNQINAGELIGYKQDKTDYDRLILLTRGATLQGIVAY